MTPREARSFLLAGGKDLPSPGALPGITKAADLLARAIKTGAPILVHGDYDADGISATALLTSVLSRFGGRLYYFVPNRHRHGYGVSEEAIRDAQRAGVRVFVTVDCGTTAIKPLQHAKGIGMRTIVIDHHEPRDTLPPVAAIVNPKLAGSEYPFPDLCATALAFKVAQAVSERMGRRVRVDELPVELVAIATIADIMPLVGENRIFVREGLHALRSARHIGLRVLSEVAGLDPRDLRSFHLSFILGPRLNAAGRMDDPKPALRLLLTRDETEARQIAKLLDDQNRRRQREEDMILRHAVEMVETELDLDRERVIVLASPEWHPGVIGIVATRLVELYHRPVFLIAFRDGIGHGSARSIEGFSVATALHQCRDLLLSGGGHKMAGGFRIACEQIPAFRDALNTLAEEWLTDEDLMRRIRVDAEVTAEEVTLKTVGDLAALEPTGFGNEKPVFLLRNGQIVHVSAVNDRLLLRIKQRERVLELVGDQMGAIAEELSVGDTICTCFTAEVRSVAGLPTLNLQIVDLAPPRSETVSVQHVSPK